MSKQRQNATMSGPMLKLDEQGSPMSDTANAEALSEEARQLRERAEATADVTETAEKPTKKRPRPLNLELQAGARIDRLLAEMDTETAVRVLRHTLERYEAQWTRECPCD